VRDPRFRSHDLLLVLDDRSLVPHDLFLILGDDPREVILLHKDLLLIRDDPFLILDGRDRHREAPRSSVTPVG
jgi:hypothetical protein